ncbi:MAG: HD domain-containing protein, partial [Alistipes sp.]|nr:HD domain-containing protein [Alistipes sp.]
MDLKLRYESLWRYSQETFSQTTCDLVEKALSFAAERMEGYLRYDGSPMLDHDVAVAEIVAREIGLGRNSTVAAILHDVLRIANAE